MLIPSRPLETAGGIPSLSRRVNANSQRKRGGRVELVKLIKKGEC